ncbi:hypothetical protein C0993_004195 [Termitomyces sp. T159_Od127]|nr:hypothetical protein C0993_004195 [Termitomyces sp. T159_Od127]
MQAPATTLRHAQWWTRLWHTEPGIVEAFPPPLSHRPMIQHKPSLPNWALPSHAAQRTSFDSMETIVADPRVHELEEMVLALQAEIEETRQNQSGTSGIQNGTLMRELVTTTHSGLLDEHSQFQENGDHDSVTMSTTVF